MKANRVFSSPQVCGFLWISPWLIGLAVFLVIPMALSLWYSLTDYPLLEPPVFVGLENYQRLLHDPLLLRVIGNTCLYTLASVFGSTALAIGVALLLNRSVRGQTIYRALVFAPCLIPAVAAAVVWLWMYNGEIGGINRLIGDASGLIGLPINGPNWLGHPRWAMVAMILMSFWTVGPAVVIYLAALQDVPKSLLEAARVDGMGRWGQFRHITLPMISPVILFNVIIAVLSAWQIFAAPFIMTGGGPDRATYFFSMYLYDIAFSYGQMGYASVLAWLQLLIVLLITAMCLWASRKLVFYR